MSEAAFAHGKSLAWPVMCERVGKLGTPVKITLDDKQEKIITIWLKQSRTW